MPLTGKERTAAYLFGGALALYAILKLFEPPRKKRPKRYPARTFKRKDAARRYAAKKGKGVRKLPSGGYVVR